MSAFRPTIRTRLTLVYGSLVFGAGVVMLGLTWLLMAGQLTSAADGVVVSASDNVDPTPPAVAEQHATAQPNQVNGSGTIDSGDLQAFAIEVSQRSTSVALQSLLMQGGVAVLVVSAAGAAIAWVIARRMLKPIASITDAAQRISDAPDAERRVRERITIEGPDDEIRRLARTFDGMLERLDRSFEAQRRFVANASHELRTPLTVNRTLIEVALDREHVGEDVRVLGESLLQVNGRHERLIEGLLLLARSERDAAAHTFVDLGDVVEHVLDTIDFEASAVTLHRELAEAPTTGDPVLFEHLVSNLVGNGVRHNVASDGWISVRTGQTVDGKAKLQVSNSGPIVPPYEVKQLFEPFHRLVDERMARSNGVGLGLSISRAIVQTHGGEITLTARPEGGLTVTVLLPGAVYGDDDDV